MTEKIAEKPSVTLPGTVEKIIEPIHRVCRKRRRLQSKVPMISTKRFALKNSLTDENGDEVQLREGARVEVTVGSRIKRSHSATEKMIGIYQENRRQGLALLPARTAQRFPSFSPRLGNHKRTQKRVKSSFLDPYPSTTRCLPRTSYWMRQPGPNVP